MQRLKPLAVAVHSAAVTDSPALSQPASVHHFPATCPQMPNPTTLAAGSFGWRPEPSTKTSGDRQDGFNHTDSCSSALHRSMAGSRVGVPSRHWLPCKVLPSAMPHLPLQSLSA